MATRYSGNVTITLKYNDNTSQYDCSVSTGGSRAKTHVRPPASSRLSVDSPEAYDETAKAAFSFTQDDLDDASPEYDGGTSIVIHRKKPHASAPKGYKKA